MTAYYLDASALSKRYVQETGTVWVRALVTPAAGYALSASVQSLMMPFRSRPWETFTPVSQENACTITTDPLSAHFKDIADIT